MKFIQIFCFLILSFSAFAQDKKTSFNFSGINVSQAIQLIYGEVLKSDYVIDPDVLMDQRIVSFRYKSLNGEVRPFSVIFLDQLGYNVSARGGVDYISKKK